MSPFIWAGWKGGVVDPMQPRKIRDFPHPPRVSVKGVHAVLLELAE
jgi:hypothetical protein